MVLNHAFSLVKQQYNNNVILISLLKSEQVEILQMLKKELDIL